MAVHDEEELNGEEVRARVAREVGVRRRIVCLAVYSRS
jgi:hypothetical protein